MMRRVLPIELGMGGQGNFVWQAMRRGEAIAEDDASDEATFDSLAIFYGHITAVNECLLLGIPLQVIARAASKE